MQRNIASGFEDSFRRHLAVEQRRAVLDTIARELTPDTTLGDIVDAAHDLGWAEGLGDLCLSDLALALFGEADAPAPVATAPLGHADEADDADADADDDADDDTDDEADDDIDQGDTDIDTSDEEPAANSGRKLSSLDRAVDRIEKTLAAARKVRSKKAAKVAAKKVAKAAARIPAPAPAPPAKAKAKAKAAAKVAPVKAVKAGRAPFDVDDEDDDTDAMSLDQAAKLLVPLVRKLREATMQDLEEQTKMGRRKLRFHIGQLVKHGRLRRHGMGRGTCYTVK